MKTYQLKIDRMSLGLLLTLLFTGCAYKSLPEETRKSYDYDPVPRVVVTPVPVVEKRVALDALAKSMDMTVAIDMKNGHRYLKGQGNQITIMPGRREAVVNGSRSRIDQPVMWQNGKLVAHQDLESTLRRALADNPIVQRRVAITKNVSHPKPKKTSLPKYSGKLPSVPSTWNFPANRRWKYIVIHHSATKVGGAKSFHRSHAKKWRYGLGYHFVVGNGSETQTGQVEVGRRWKLQNKGIHGAHAGVRTYNQAGIGICLVGNFQGKGPGKQQMAALKQLVQLLMKRYKIPKSRVLGHKTARPGHTDCPGKRFPMK
ncbi:MAG: peptidoglycan recognition family protein, partial [Planctomycetota bacterium]|nr:peptidoglycan recognition family protein [Planctomycetota bacterium]